MRGLGIIGTKWRRAKVAVIEVRVRIPRSLGRPATCLEPAPFPGVSSAEFPPHRLVPGSVGGPFLERLNSYLPPPSSTPAFLCCLSHFLPQPLPPRCVEEDNQVRTNVAPAFPRKRKKGGSAAMNVDHEINLLVEEIHRLGSKNADGKLSVKFGVLFRDDKCANLFEALVGTLKAAKRRKIVTNPSTPCVLQTWFAKKSQNR
uniref:Costars family protein ABRACL n=1 Tax=Ursus maritimus TaxID=29073 RepID=A0A452VH02_URSMA